MTTGEKPVSGWSWIQRLVSQPRRRKRQIALQPESLEARVMLSAVAIGSADIHVVDPGGNLPTFSEFDLPGAGQVEEAANSEANDGTIIGNPSLQDQFGSDEIRHAGDGPPVHEFGHQIEADPTGNLNQFENTKGQGADQFTETVATIVDDDETQTPAWTSSGFEYETTSDWGSGFNGQITLTNVGSTAWSDWTVEFDWDRNITQIWNAEIISQTGNHYVIRNVSWNGGVAGDAAVSFGFGGNPGNVMDTPTNVMINGIPVNDAPPPAVVPNISIADISLNEGDSGSTTAVFTVSLSEVSSTAVTVDYVTVDGTALASSDYASGLGTLLIDAGQTTATIAVSVLGDTDDEANETFSLNLSNAVGAEIDDGLAVATIVDDDETQTPPSTSSGFEYETTSDWGSGFNGQITLTNVGSTAWSDWTVEFDWDRNITQIWNAEIISQTGNHYVIRNVSWNGGVAGDAAVSFGFGGNPGNVMDTPTNVMINGIPVNDAPPPAVVPNISIADISLNEGDSGSTTAVFTVSLSEVSSTAVTVDYVTVDGTALASSDYASGLGTLLIDAGQTTATIAVSVLGDTDDEANETFSLNLSNAVGAEIDDGLAVATIVDDDETPTPPSVDSVVSISDAAVTEGDSGFTTATFTVSLNEPSDQQVTLDYETRDGSAVTGLDYVSSSGSIAIQPGDTTQTITIDVVGDTVDEATENFYIDLLGIAGAFSGDTTGQGTILDDDENRPSDPAAGTRIVGYFPSWGIYGRDYQVEDIPAEKLTHINYAFANIGADLRVTMGDAYADGINFASLRTLKQQHTQLQTLISVGGWTWSERFSDVALTAVSRTAFAESAVEFMLEHGFDGIDIDWEYPVSGGEWDNVNRPEDKQNYTLLMQELRTQLDVLEAQHGRDYWLSIAAPAGPGTMQNFEIANLANTLDWINLMAYDLAGHWDPQTGHNAPLYDQADNPADDRLDWNSAIDAYLSAGVPNDKLVIGAPFYGRVFGGVGSTNNGLYQPDTQIVSGTDGQSGYLSYWDIQDRYLSEGSGYTRYWDSEAQVPYLYNPDTQQFVTYDDEQSIGLKADYINDRELGGLMFWELATDARDHSLLDTVYDRISAPAGPPLLRVTDTSVVEGNSGTTTLTFIVSLTRASDASVTVDFGTQDGTAVAGSDYLATFGTLTLAAGETSKELAVDVLGEALEEVNESLLLRLSNAVGADIGVSQATGSILDDDTPIAVGVAFEITGDWGSGHTGNVTMTNHTTETITHWRLEFDYSGEIQGVWSSVLVTRSGNRYVVEYPSWATDIAPGATVTFGWTGNGLGGQLSNVTLNGLQAILS